MALSTGKLTSFFDIIVSSVSPTIESAMVLLLNKIGVGYPKFIPDSSIFILGVLSETSLIDI
jgi:hypothetical protein